MVLKPACEGLANVVVFAIAGRPTSRQHLRTWAGRGLATQGPYLYSSTKPLANPPQNTLQSCKIVLKETSLDTKIFIYQQ